MSEDRRRPDDPDADAEPPEDDQAPRKDKRDKAKDKVHRTKPGARTRSKSSSVFGTDRAPNLGLQRVQKIKVAIPLVQVTARVIRVWDPGTGPVTEHQQKDKMQLGTRQSDLCSAVFHLHSCSPKTG